MRKSIKKSHWAAAAVGIVLGLAVGLSVGNPNKGAVVVLPESVLVLDEVVVSADSDSIGTAITLDEVQIRP